MLTIENLTINRDGKPIVNGLDLSLPAGEVHALMGPNGSGKSTLAGALMGHPAHEITGGRIMLDGDDISEAPPEERSRKGLFLSMQYPPELAGVSLSSALRAAVNARRETPMGVVEFHDLLKRKMEELGMDPSFAGRGLNEGFSGGEKKRAEILQLSLLEPKYAILDETDSGLDVDALRAVTDGIARVRDGMGILIITHYARILEHLRPDRVHVMSGGRIAASGGPELAERIEKEGYSFLGT